MKNIQEISTRLQSLKRSFTTNTKIQSQAHNHGPQHLFSSTLLPRKFPLAEGIAKMPVLTAVAEAGKGLINFEDTAFFSVQHILYTNLPLFKHLIKDFNAKPENIYLSGKGYSDCAEVEHLLKKTLGIQYFKLPKTYETTTRYQHHLRNHLSRVWDVFLENIGKSVKRIIIMDEGGHSLETMPGFLCFEYSMAGIEQTRGGLYSPAIDSLPFPLIEVASCALKRHLESPLIVQAVVKKLQKALGARADVNSKTIFGVIGNGAIGSSVTRYLIDNGHRVIVYDENKDAFHGLVHKNLYRAEHVNIAIERADYILGCTGKDILKDIDPNFLHTAGKKKVISCTSEDKEWYSLRKLMGGPEVRIELDTRNDITYYTEAGGVITLVNVGDSL